MLVTNFLTASALPPCTFLLLVPYHPVRCAYFWKLLGVVLFVLFFLKLSILLTEEHEKYL